MKILGKNEVSYGVKSYIVEINENEIANLLGFYSHYAMRDNGKEHTFKCGEEIDVSALYSDSEKLKEIKKEFEKFEQFFKGAADFYITAKTTFKKVGDE